MHLSSLGSAEKIKLDIEGAKGVNNSAIFSS